MLRAAPLGPNVGVLLGPFGAARVRARRRRRTSARRPTTRSRACRRSCARRMAAGALGFATSLLRRPRRRGRPTGTEPAGDARASCARSPARWRAGGRGVLEITPATFPIAEDELAFLQELARRDRTPGVSFSAILDLPDRDGVWEPVLDAPARGARPERPCRPAGVVPPDALRVRSRDRLRVARRPALLAAFPRRRRAVTPALLADARVPRRRQRDRRSARPDSPSSKRWATVVLEEARHPAHLRFVGGTLADVAAARGGDVDRRALRSRARRRPRRALLDAAAQLRRRRASPSCCASPRA